MFAGTLNEKAAPTIEVRIYRNDRLVIRENCQSEEEAAAIAAQASDLDHVYLLVDDAVPDPCPGDVFLNEDPFPEAEKDRALADQQLSGYGVE